MPRWNEMVVIQCDVRKCFNPAVVIVEGGHALCDHHDRGTRVKKYICKFCKVEIISDRDTRAILGKEHKKSCRRHKKDL